MTCLPWTWEGGSQQVSPPFLVGVTRERASPRVEGGWGDQLPPVLWSGVSTGCPLPSLILILTLVRAPVRAGDPRHLPPLIYHFSWEALLEETNSGRGGNKPLHRLPEHSQAWDVSTRGRQGLGGGDSRGQRDREASTSALLLPFPCSPQPPGHGMGLGLRLLTLFKVSFSLSHTSHLPPYPSTACGKSQTDPALGPWAII